MHKPYAMPTEHGAEVDGSTRATLLLSPDGRIRSWDRTAARWLGADAELAGRPVQELLRSPSRSLDLPNELMDGEPLELEAELACHGDPQRVHASIERLSGSGEQLAATLRTMDNGSGGSCGTEEEEHQRLRSLFDATLDATAEGILVTDMDGTIARVNEAFIEMWGIDAETSEARDANRLLASVLDTVADPDRFLARIRRLYDEPDRTYTDRIELADGRVIERTSRPRRVDGEIVGRVSSFRDISEHEKAKAGLQRARSLDRAILEATADGILVVDLDGNLVAYNQRFQEMWGFPDRLIEEGDDAALIEYALDRIEEPDAFLERIQALYDQPEAESFDTIRFKDGRVFERVAKPQRLDGEVVGRVWSFRDVTHHKRVQQRLRRSEEELRALFDNLPIGLYRTTPDGRAVLVNDALVEMIGFDKPEEILTRDLEADDELFEPDYPREEFRRTLREEDQIRGLEARWTLKDGSELYVRESARTVRDEDGEILYYEGTVEDVSERVRAEQALKASQRRLETVLSHAPVLLVVLDSEGRVSRLEGSGLQAYGIEEEDLIGRDARAVPQLNDQTRAAIDRALAGEPAQSTLELRGTWIQAQFVPLPGSHGQPGGVASVLVDITERKQAEDELRESQEMLDTLVSNAPVILSMIEPDGEITYVAGAGLDALDLSADELIGTNAFDAYPEGHEHHENLRRALSGEATSETIPVADHWLQVRSVPIRDKDGEMSGVIRVGMDVTARREAMEEVRRLNETLEQRVEERTAELEALNEELKAFSYSVSHDLRGPLQTIDGFSQILLEDHADAIDDDAQHLLERIRNASQTMDQRIEALLALARVTRKPLEIETVDLSELAETILSDLAHRSPDREVEIQIEEGLTARADPQLVHALLDNLLRNAWKFSRQEEPAKIHVGREDTQQGEVFFVRDNGVGFQPGEADRLFEPFHRAAGDGFEGTRVGLASVERIVQRHGGEIQAEGRPGEGATFRFTLKGG